VKIHLTSAQWGKSKRKMSVSERIRQKKSKKVKPVKRVRVEAKEDKR
jgi:hypothetical protein